LKEKSHKKENHEEERATRLQTAADLFSWFTSVSCKSCARKISTPPGRLCWVGLQLKRSAADNLQPRTPRKHPTKCEPENR